MTLDEGNRQTDRWTNEVARNGSIITILAWNYKNEIFKSIKNFCQEQDPSST